MTKSLIPVCCLALCPAVLPAQQTDVPSVSFEAQGPPSLSFRTPRPAAGSCPARPTSCFSRTPGFHSPYEGTNSLLARGEYKTSLVGTLFTGYQLNPRPRFATDVLFDLESAGGRGISEAVVLAGFTNLDVVRNPSLGPKPYVARFELHQVLGLSSELVQGSRTPFSLATQVPARRLDLRAGLLSLPDVFDLNGPGF